MTGAIHGSRAKPRDVDALLMSAAYVDHAQLGSFIIRSNFLHITPWIRRDPQKADVRSEARRDRRVGRVAPYLKVTLAKQHAVPYKLQCNQRDVRGTGVVL